MSSAPSIRNNPIAIVGMACLMPDARSIASFWHNIVHKVDSVTDVPADHWAPEDYYDSDPLAPDKVYSKRGAFIPKIQFNPLEWGLPPKILQATDTNQLLSLVVAKDCLEDAGIVANSQHDRSRIGVVLGVACGQKIVTPLAARMQYPVLERVLRKSGVPDDKNARIVELFKAQYPSWEENTFPGSLGNVVAGRIANRLDLGGINMVTDAACASALGAVRIAVNELLLGHSDLMLTGGACTDNSVFMYMSFSKTPAFTSGQRSRPFDQGSDGMLVGEGIGMIALKRLRDAEADGDRIYAVLRGVGSSSDGRYKSIYAPRPEGQKRALERAYADAGFAASTVSLIEAHGTGTSAGDQAEVQGLGMVFDGDPDGQHVAIGSVKSQIGHLKAAAGIAGLIKVALALHHKVLPPTINVDVPSPRLKLGETPFYVNTETRPWLPRADGQPRRAGVSAFGFGGTNFHIALEEHTSVPDGAYRLNMPSHAFLLAAQGGPELLAMLTELRASLAACVDPAQLASLSKRFALRPIPHEQVRAGFVAESVEQAQACLSELVAALQNAPACSEWQSLKGIWYRQRGEDLRGRIAALFPGQGSQYVGMGCDLACSFPAFMAAISRADAASRRHGPAPLSKHLYPIPVFDHAAREALATTLRQTQWAQPAIAAMSAGMYALASAAGLAPDFAAGHSFGELTALWAAGVFDDETFHALASARGKAMQAPPGLDPGGMIAVGSDERDRIAAVLQQHREITIANYNSPRQLVLGGPSDALDRCRADLARQGVQAIALPVSAAFHTRLVAQAQVPFGQELARSTLRAPKLPVYSNVSAERHSDDPQRIRALLEQHLTSPVRFHEQVERMYAAGARVFVEIGPKSVLSKLVDEILGTRPHLTVPLNPNPGRGADPQLRAALVQLAVRGVQLRDFDRSWDDRPLPHTLDASPLKIELSAANYLNPDVVASRRDTAELTPQFQVPHTEKVMRNREMQPHSQQGDMGVDGDAAVDAWVARSHERFLAASQAYNQGLISLLQRQIELAAATPGFDLPPGVERSLAALHQQQTQALRAHETFLAQVQGGDTQERQERVSTRATALPAQSIAPAPLPARIEPAIAPPMQLAARFEPQSSESSPAHLAPPPAAAMAVTAPAPVAPTPPPRTATVPAAVTSAPVSSTIAAAPVAPTPVRPPQLSAPTVADSHASAVATAVAAADVPNQEELQKQMLAVVAEKTGYPAEMLELGMDMESDLGIDSIKRVEILGTVQYRFPKLPPLDPMALSELRTLAEVADYVLQVFSEIAQPASEEVSREKKSPNLATTGQHTVSFTG